MTDRINTRADRFAIMDAGMSGILPAIKLRSYLHIGRRAICSFNRFLLDFLSRWETLAGEIRRAFFVVSQWSTNGPSHRLFFEHSSRAKAGTGGTACQGAIGQPDQGLDPEFWHSPWHTSRHNEVCREMVHF
ncbi:MAG: hypothetical protein A3D94_15215 [Alphaproteobacteria bacterium RIFCSPHIGHO2_12_FULL_66_14]|nr:MAG: hypothetical protein A3D94_15215 [Alphaproteobacteria bacterium RIFCSPHIGHO2_12_FULL_66_14]